MFTNKPRRQDRYVVAALVLIISFYIFLALINFNGFDEDAFISFRYAENLARGHGPIFNPGERTEGISNPLWTFILAVFHLLGFPIPAAAMILGIVFSALAGLMLFYAGREIDPEHPAPALLAPLLLFTDIHYIIWSARGLENGQVAFLIALVLYLYSREKNDSTSLLLPVVSGLLAVSRPEAGLVALVIFFDWAVRRRPWSYSTLVLFWQRFYSFFIIVIGYELFRIAFYHELLPCSYYFKVASRALPERLQAGLIYCLSYLIYDKWFILGLPVIGLARDSRGEKAYRAGTMVIIIYFVFIVLSGGDMWFKQNFRFIVFFMPLLFFLAAEGLRRFYYWKKNGRALYVVGLCIILFGHWFLWHSASPFYQRTLAYGETGLLDKLQSMADGADFKIRHYPIVLRGEPIRKPGSQLALLKEAMIEPWRISLIGMVGHDIGMMSKPGERLATTVAGMPPFFSGLSSLDLLGLNDVDIARGRISPEEKLRRFNPQYVLVVFQEWGTPRFDTPVIFTPWFEEKYLLTKIYAGAPGTGALVLFEPRAKIISTSSNENELLGQRKVKIGTSGSAVIAELRVTRWDSDRVKSICSLVRQGL